MLGFCLLGGFCLFFFLFLFRQEELFSIKLDGNFKSTLLWGSAITPVLGRELIHRDWNLSCTRKFVMKQEDFMRVYDLKG